MKLLLSFLIMQVFAMKPGPFEDVHYEDPQTHYRVESLLDKKDKEFSSTGHTVIYDSKKQELWRSSVFTGRKKLNLSPDGQTLALIGNFHFTSLIQPSPEQVIVELVNKKGTLKAIRFSDLYKGDSQKLIEKYKITVEGGGWSAFNDFIKDLRIDWNKKNILIKFIDGKEHNFSF